MLISLAALAYLYVWESFIWTLIFFFLTMICGFHWLFFRYDSLTQTHIRMIDYPYLMAVRSACSSLPFRDKKTETIFIEPWMTWWHQPQRGD